jgi:hypothetical protein
MTGKQGVGSYVKFTDGSYLTLDASGYWGFFDRFGTEQFKVTQAGALIGSLAIGPTQLGTVTDGVTLDQSGAGSTLEVKALGIANAQISASAAIAKSKLAALGIVPADLGTITDAVTLDQSGTGSTLEVKLGGAPITRAYTLQKAETGTADTNVLTYALPAAAGNFRLTVTASVTSATNGVIGFTGKFGAGGAQALSIFQAGTAAPALTFTTSAAGRYYGFFEFDNSAGAQNFVVGWVGGGTSVDVVSAMVEQLA